MFFFFLGTKENANNYISTIRNYIYSLWICKRYNFKDVFFKRKINYILGSKYIKIGSKVSFGKQLVLTVWYKHNNYSYSPQIQIGDGCNFGDYLHLTAINEIIIGNNVLTGRWVTITDNSHGQSTYSDLCIPPLKRGVYSPGSVFIEDDVWIGDKVTILPGVRIGKGSIIGANSVVTKNIPSFCIVGGNPARIIKNLSCQSRE